VRENHPDAMIAREDEAGAARVFNLARQDVAGFEDYARRIRVMFAGSEQCLCDLMEGLFHIAMADGQYHPAEDAFLNRVAEILGLPDAEFAALRARYVPDAPKDPWTVLGLSPGTPLDAVRAQFRRLVRENHPDAMIARGLPPEAVKLAERRMADINRAWDAVQATVA